jgi:hypothetical protein
VLDSEYLHHCWRICCGQHFDVGKTNQGCLVREVVLSGLRKVGTEMSGTLCGTENVQFLGKKRENEQINKGINYMLILTLINILTNLLRETPSEST